MLGTASQIMMKFVAGNLQAQPFGAAWMLAAGACPYLWATLALEILNFSVWMAILRRHALSIAFLLSSITYVSVALAGVWLFREPVGALQAAGMVVILIGILLMGHFSVSR
ncbi:MAG: transporter [Pseudomonadota bacterium]|nr:transporter [Pseudomonadota bacterium]